MTAPDQAGLTAAYAEELAALDELLGDLPEEAWATPTACPGWDVQANVAHVIGIEALLLGEAHPALPEGVSQLPHVRNDLGASNEAWVRHLAAATPEQALAGYRERAAARLEALRSLTAEQWEAEAATAVGPDAYGRYMRIRLMDIWMHEQDIREAVGRPGHDTGPVVRFVLDELVGSLGYVVGKKAGAPDGASVTFDLTGPDARSVHVLVDGRAAIVGSLPGPATTTLSMPALLFTRLAGGRAGADAGAVELSGDEALGRRIADHLGFMI